MPANAKGLNHIHVLSSSKKGLSLKWDVTPRLRQVFGTGPNKNWLHIQLIPVSPKGAYSAPTDCPKYINKEGSQYGPNCAGGGSSSVTPSDLGSTGSSDASVLSDAGSPAAIVGTPAEQAQIAQLMTAVNADQGPQPDTSVADMLLGPMLRGTQVTLP